MRGQSSGRPDNRGRAGPETAAVSRGPILTNHSGHTKTDEEKQRMSDETNDRGARWRTGSSARSPRARRPWRGRRRGRWTMPRGNIRARLERLRERVGPPEGPGDIEARERALRALETIRRLILKRGDEIGRGYGERVGRGEEHLPALVDAKRDALGKTEEGREAGAVAYALEDRTGEGGS